MGELVTAGSPPTRSTTNGTTVPAADSMSATKARGWQRTGKAGKEGGNQGEREQRNDEMKVSWHAGYWRRIPPEMASTTVTNVDKETTAEYAHTQKSHQHLRMSFFTDSETVRHVTEGAEVQRVGLCEA
jgi:hypothetical protein